MRPQPCAMRPTIYRDKQSRKINQQSGGIPRDPTEHGGKSQQTSELQKMKKYKVNRREPDSRERHNWRILDNFLNCFRERTKVEPSPIVTSAARTTPSRPGKRVFIRARGQKYGLDAVFSTRTTVPGFKDISMSTPLDS
uniref:Uncharacterized protein n=1 Tax=Strigamia maritima TaxID=126957 RepID=T1IV36_STRMM